MKKVISWCFYLTANLERLPEYLVGMKLNQYAAQLFFPGWRLRLYVNDSVLKNRLVMDYMDELNNGFAPAFELIPCRPGCNPMVERYRVFFDNIDVALVRDLDSILSLVDAENVAKWLSGDEEVFYYREYLMALGLSMGGGFGARVKPLREHVSSLPLILQTGRNQDEPLVKKMIETIAPLKQMVVLTRMDNRGIYYMCDDADAEGNNRLVLWMVPFFECLRGYAKNGELKYASLEEIVAYSRKVTIRAEHIDPQLFSLSDLVWVR